MGEGNVTAYKGAEFTAEEKKVTINLNPSGGLISPVGRRDVNTDKFIQRNFDDMDSQYMGSAVNGVTGAGITYGIGTRFFQGTGAAIEIPAATSLRGSAANGLRHLRNFGSKIPGGKKAVAAALVAGYSLYKVNQWSDNTSLLIETSQNQRGEVNQIEITDVQDGTLYNSAKTLLYKINPNTGLIEKRTGDKVDGSFLTTDGNILTGSWDKQGYMIKTAKRSAAQAAGGSVTDQQAVINDLTDLILGSDIQGDTATVKKALEFAATHLMYMDPENKSYTDVLKQYEQVIGLLETKTDSKTKLATVIKHAKNRVSSIAYNEGVRNVGDINATAFRSAIVDIQTKLTYASKLVTDFKLDLSKPEDVAKFQQESFARFGNNGLMWLEDTQKLVDLVKKSDSEFRSYVIAGDTQNQLARLIKLYEQKFGKEIISAANELQGEDGLHETAQDFIKDSAGSHGVENIADEDIDSAQDLIEFFSGETEEEVEKPENPKVKPKSGDPLDLLENKKDTALVRGISNGRK